MHDGTETRPSSFEGWRPSAATVLRRSTFISAFLLGILGILGQWTAARLPAAAVTGLGAFYVSAGLCPRLWRRWLAREVDWRWRLETCAAGVIFFVMGGVPLAHAAWGWPG